MKYYVYLAHVMNKRQFVFCIGGIFGWGGVHRDASLRYYAQAIYYSVSLGEGAVCQD